MLFLFRQFALSKREGAILGVIGLILFIGILFISSELYDCYHFVDDHVVLLISEYANHHTVMETLQWFINIDFSIRFRPLYNIELVLQTYMLGTNMNHWIMLVMCEGVISFLLFYFFARRLNLSPAFAFFFSGLIHFGGQFTPWYRALNQENLAMVFMGMTLCCLTLKKHWATGLAGIFAVLASLQKESFSLLLPAYPLIHCFLEQKDISEHLLKQYIRHHAVFVGILCGIFLSEIYCIVFLVGTNKIGYAGFGGGTPLMVYVKTLVSSMARSMYYLTPLTIYTGWILGKHYKENRIFEKYSPLIIFAIYIVFSQLALHAKSGIWERYMLPFMVGWALLVVFLPAQLNLEKNVKRAFIILCIVTLFIGIGKSYKVAEYWASLGNANRILLAEIEKGMAIYKGKPLLFYIDGCELDVGAKAWLKYFVKPDLNVTIYKYDKVLPNPIPQYPIIVISTDKEKDRTFFDTCKIDENNYTRKIVGNELVSYIVLYRKDKGNP